MHRLTSSLPAYACHVTRTWSRDTHSTMEESCFQQKFSGKKTTNYYSTPSLTGKKKSSKLVCWLKKLDDKWSLNSANFCRCRSCDFTDLNTTTGKQIPRRDWFSWQEVMSFTGSSLYRLLVGAVPVKKPLQWLPVISPVDPGTSTRGLSTGGTVGVPVPVMFL